MSSNNSPLQNSEAMPLGTANPSARADTRVLVVDDERLNRNLLRDLLDAQGYEVIEAENGTQALASAARDKPDLIMLDVMMPGLDGFEVCRQLKQNAQTAPIPVIIVTALSERQERMMGIQAGANDFVTKPVDTQELSLRVANALHTKQLYNQLQIEQQRAEQLLLNTLPLPIAQRLKQGETTIAEHHPDATILFADLVGFTSLVSAVGAGEVVFLLNEVFSVFDVLAQEFQLEKIKTLGSIYVVAGGLGTCDTSHTQRAAALASAMLSSVTRFNEQNNASLCVRIGMSTGPVVAVVIGRKKLAYDVWGTPVSMACTLETSAAPNTIQVDDATYERLTSICSFAPAREILTKNYGAVITRALLSLNTPKAAPDFKTRSISAAT